MFIVLGLCHCCVMQNTPILFYFSYSFCVLFSLSLISFFFHILTCDNHKFIPKLTPRLVKPHDSQTHEALDQFPSPSGITSSAGVPTFCSVWMGCSSRLLQSSRPGTSHQPHLRNCFHLSSVLDTLFPGSRVFLIIGWLQWLPEKEYLGSKWVFEVLSANVVIYPAQTIH